MAEFEVKCPHCKTVLEASDEWIDMETECPVCKGVFTIQRPIVEKIANAVDDQNVPAQTAVQKTFFRSIKFYVIAAVILAAGAIAVILACMIGDNYEPSSNFEYSIEDGCVTIQKYKGPSPVVKIPPKIKRRKVTIISEKAFADYKRMTSVIIPEGVTIIGDLAFKDCKGLTSITIPDSVVKIGDGAFYGCKGLTSITIPDSVTEIGKLGGGVFWGCTSLTVITIPDSVAGRLHVSSFKGCSSLTDVTISNGINCIDMFAFDGCKSLTRVTIPDSVKKINELAFYGCTSLTQVSVSPNVKIASDAFPKNCKVVFRNRGGMNSDAQKENAIKIDMRTPLSAKKTYMEAIMNLSRKELLEFALTWDFELRSIVAKGESPFSVAIDLWHDRTLQDRIAFVKDKYPDEFSKKYTQEVKEIGKFTPEFVLSVRMALAAYFAGKIIRENQSKNDENRWDNSGRIYFR